MGLLHDASREAVRILSAVFGLWECSWKLRVNAYRDLNDGPGVSSPEVERPAKIFGVESCHETEWGVEHVR